MGGAADDSPYLQTGPTVEEMLFGPRQGGVSASHPLSRSGNKSIFGYIGSSGSVALGPPDSLMRRYAGLDTPDTTLSPHWLYPENGTANVFTVGYSWRDLKFERSVFSSETPDQPANKNLLKLDSRSLRLSYNPSPSWTLQISRGSISGLDQMVPNGDVKRTTISATYHTDIQGSEWQTTLAWGRNARKFRETTMGYLFESTLRFSGANVFFGRLEQVGSDELMRENESVQARLFKMNKLTLGYFRNVNASARVKFDVGILANRHFIPSEMATPYGASPTGYMVFIRLKPQ